MAPCRAPRLAAAFAVLLGLAAAAPWSGGLGAVRGATRLGRRTGDILRFGPPGKATEQAFSKIISGVIDLQAEVPDALTKEMTVPMRQGLAQVLNLKELMVLMSDGVPSNPRLREGRTVPLRDFEFRYQVLTPEGTAESLVKTLQQAFKHPPLSRFLQAVIRKTEEYEPTTKIWIDAWNSTLRGFDVAFFFFVLRVPQVFPWAESTAPPTTTSTAPSTTTQTDISFGDCWAVSQPCACALLPGCTWAQDPSGFPCWLAADLGVASGVSCEACPSQERCLPAGCSSITKPCACAEAPAGCHWEDASGRCLQSSGGAGTSCAACSRQAVCSPPVLYSFVPAPRTTLQLPTHLAIRLRFDRPMVIADSSKATFLCAGQAQPSRIPPSDMSVEGNDLLVSVKSILGFGGVDEQGSPLECRMALVDGLIKDSQGVAYETLAGYIEYTFRLGDTVAPHVASVDPPFDGLLGEGIQRVAFTFNERIFWSGSARFLQSKFGALDSVDAGDAAVPASSFDFEPPRVQLDGNVVTVDLSSEVLREGVLYTVSLPAGGVVDAAGNIFEGLPMRTYSFRAGIATVRSSEPVGGTMPQSVLYATIGGGGFAASVFCGYLAARSWRLRRKRIFSARPPPAKSTSVVQPEAWSAPRASYARPTVVPAAAPTAPGVGAAMAGGLRRTGWTSPEDTRAPPDFPPSPTSDWGTGTWGSGMWDTASAGTTRSTGRAPSHTCAGAAAAGQHRSSLKRSTTMGPTASAGRRASGAASGAAVGGASAGGSPGRARGYSASSAASQASDSPSAPPPQRRSASEGPSPGCRAGAARGGAGSRPSARESGQDASGGGARSSRSAAPAASPMSTPEGEVKQKKLEIERRFRDLMGSPLAERKKALRELILQYHPDKNSDPNATDIFQFINASRAWFLVEN